MFASYFRSLKESELIELDSPKSGAWIRIEGTDKKALAKFAKTYELEVGHLNDAIDPLEVPRLELEGSTIYLFTRTPVKDEGSAVTVPFLIVIAEEHLITVSNRRITSLDQWIAKDTSIITTQKSKLLLQLLQQSNTSYVTHINTIAREIRALSLQLHTADIQNREIVQLVSYEGVLQDFISALIPTNAILTQLLTGKIIKFYEEDKDLVEDLVLSTNQLVELSRANLKTIVSLREASATIMTNNLNRVIKLLTSLTVILMIPNLITGLYGMNVNLPFDKHPLAFFIVLGTIVTTTMITLYVFLRNRWL